MMRRHAYGWVCDRCGARLDPGEACECGKEAREAMDRNAPLVDMAMLKRCHVGDQDIRALKREVADVRMLTAATGADAALVTGLEEKLEARRREHARDIAAVIAGVTRIRDELTRKVAWGYYAKGKSILTIAKEQSYSQEHVRRHLRTAEKLLTGRDGDG